MMFDSVYLIFEMISRKVNKTDVTTRPLKDAVFSVDDPNCIRGLEIDNRLGINV